MKSVIILAHPYPNSFNHVIKDVVVQALMDKKEVKVIDLVKDEFDPVLSQEDLRLYMRGQSSDPKVVEYQNDLMDCDDLVLIFPIWWYEAPAILKGFLDKVLLSGYAFDEINNQLVGKLSHIRRLTVISTSEVLSEFMRNEVGNPIEISLMKTTLGVCGIQNDMLWLNCEKIASGTLIERESFLNNVKTRFHG
ncbi:MAG TPA: NAD(P)H-dependent oxidoreductase [Erysipelotrichaceae bacterium]|nr:NAD(P)H-dependent oxidoreductase [Erysipelotrichaceae bacterium]